MRSLWNGAISFGLVTIPIKLMSATENHAVSFRQIHMADGGRIRYRRVCELDDEEVDSAEIGKGYEEADGSIVQITDEDLAALPLPTAKTIEIVAFVPSGLIDPLQMDTAYYLSANGAAAAKPYTLLREALKRSERVAVAKFALRGRERLGMLRVVDEVIAMHGLLWPDELRAPEGVAPDVDVTVRDAELDLADALMNTLGEIDVTTLHDEYREALEELIAAKAGGETVPVPEPSEDTGGKVIDLMAALENSVRAAKGSGGARGTGGEAEVTHLPRKRTQSKKAAAGQPAKQSAEQPERARKSTRSAAKGTAEGTAKVTAEGPAESTARSARTAAAKKAPAKAPAKEQQSERAKGQEPAKKAPRKKPPTKRASA